MFNHFITLVVFCFPYRTIFRTNFFLCVVFSKRVNDLLLNLRFDLSKMPTHIFSSRDFFFFSLPFRRPFSRTSQKYRVLISYSRRSVQSELEHSVRNSDVGHQECVSHTEPQSPAAAPVSALMTTHMPVGHSNLLGQHIPHKCSQGQGHRQHSAFERMPATIAAAATASFPWLFSGGLEKVVLDKVCMNTFCPLSVTSLFFFPIRFIISLFFNINIYHKPYFIFLIKYLVL